MENIIKGFWNQIVGTANDTEQTETSTNSNANQGKKEEEEEKKAEGVLDAEVKKTFLKEYSEKQNISHDFPICSAEEIAKNINLTFDDEHLGIGCLIEVIEKSIDLARKPYTLCVLDNRRERRKKFFDDKKGYYDLILKFLGESEAIMKKATDDLLTALNIPFDLYENSMIAQMEKGHDQQIMMMQASVAGKLGEFLGHTKKLSMTEVKEIIKYQLGITQEKKSDFNYLINNLKGDPEKMHLIPLSINIILADYIYDKFGIEEEDSMFAMKNTMELMNDFEMCEILMQHEQSIFSLMQEISNGEGNI